MRDPNRIDPFLAAFGEVWKKNPDLRFGQLFMNLSREGMGFADTWEWEDEKWYERMAAYPPDLTEVQEGLYEALIDSILNIALSEQGKQAWLKIANENGWSYEERLERVQGLLEDKSSVVNLGEIKGVPE